MKPVSHAGGVIHCQGYWEVSLAFFSQTPPPNIASHFSFYSFSGYVFLISTIQFLVSTISILYINWYSNCWYQECISWEWINDKMACHIRETPAPICWHRLLLLYYPAHNSIKKLCWNPSSYRTSKARFCRHFKDPSLLRKYSQLWPVFIQRISILDHFSLESMWTPRYL